MPEFSPKVKVSYEVVMEVELPPGCRDYNDALQYLVGYGIPNIARNVQIVFPPTLSPNRNQG